MTFTNGNIVAAPTLSVNGETACTIQIKNGSLTADMIPANYRCLLQYGSRTSGSPTVYWTLLNPASSGSSTDIPTSLPPSGNAGGTFTAIDAVTTDTKGRVTAVNTKTVTLPASGGNATEVGGRPWVSGTSYVVGDIVSYDNKIYICTTANSGTSNPTSSTGQTRFREIAEGGGGVAHSNAALGFRINDSTTDSLSFGVNEPASKTLRFQAGTGISLSAAGDAFGRNIIIAATGGSSLSSTEINVKTISSSNESNIFESSYTAYFITNSSRTSGGPYVYLDTGYVSGFMKKGEIMTIGKRNTWTGSIAEAPIETRLVDYLSMWALISWKSGQRYERVYTSFGTNYSSYDNLYTYNGYYMIMCLIYCGSYDNEDFYARSCN